VKHKYGPHCWQDDTFIKPAGNSGRKQKGNTKMKTIATIALAALGLLATARPDTSLTYRGHLDTETTVTKYVTLSKGTWDIYGLGDGGDLDIKVYDEDYNLIDEDTAYDNEPACAIRVREDDTNVIIKIINADEYEDSLYKVVVE
jgi:hypothetical protein